MSNAQETIKNSIMEILANEPHLRQFEISSRLGLTEYHNYSTHAALASLIKSELVSAQKYHIIIKGGNLSKLAYRHFALTRKGAHSCRIRHHGMRKRDILREWIGRIFF